MICKKCLTEIELISINRIVFEDGYSYSQMELKCLCSSFTYPALYKWDKSMFKQIEEERFILERDLNSDMC